MSAETRNWLSRNVLVGFTDKRGTAWHYRQGDGNHFPGAVPIEDVRKHLFDWEADEREVFVETPDGKLLIPGKKAIVRSDTQHVMGIFAEGYQPHQYGQWLVENVSTLLDDDLQIGSAGLLRNGAVAWVSVEVPDTITTPEGVQFRPNLLACTSFDGSLATTYKRVVTNVVCDNTMAAGLNEQGQQVKYRHSSKSMSRIGEAREALAIVHGIADDFAAEVARLTDITVSDGDWDKFVTEHLAPIDPTKTGAGAKMSATLAEKKRATFRRLWTEDERVAPWKNTAYGAWQAINTFSHHENRAQGVRAERNMLRTVEGRVATEDAEAMDKLLALV